MGSKSSLIESRLRRRLAALGLPSFAEYRKLLSSQGAGSDEWQLVINGLTTHTTEWFREIDHFKELRDDFLPKWLARKMARPLRVWSVACSTGEEPYSVALLLNHFHQKVGLEYEITATDIDTEVIKKAKRGIYPVEGLARIPEEYRPGALAKGVGDSSDLLKVREHIRERISFFQCNLTELPYRVGAQFDLLLCRNVLIYFPSDVIAKVANGLFQAASPGALLLTGHSESFSNLKVDWKFLKPTHYGKPGDPK